MGLSVLSMKNVGKTKKKTPIWEYTNYLISGMVYDCFTRIIGQSWGETIVNTEEYCNPN